MNERNHSMLIEEDGTSILKCHFNKQLTTNDSEDYDGPSKFCPVASNGKKNQSHLLARCIWNVQGVERIIVYRYRVFIYFGKKFIAQNYKRHVATVIENHFREQEIWKREIDNTIRNAQCRFLQRQRPRPQS
ncbi:MAG TPA: hypothetical protein VJH70_02840 [Candidatus Paceibacterota bacterium]